MWRLALATIAIACAPPAPPARESPALAVVELDVYPRLVDGTSGAWFDGYSNAVRRFEDGDVVDLTTPVDVLPTYVRAFDDGTVWIGPEPRVYEDGAWRSFDALALGACADPPFRALTARAPDDVWLAAGGVLCHYDGTTWTAEPTALEITSLAAVESGLYASTGTVFHRGWGATEFEDIAIPDVAQEIAPLEDTIIVNATIETDGGYEDHLFIARGHELEALPPARGETLVGATRDDVWALVRIVATDSGECTFDASWGFLCPGVVHYTQDVVLHLEDGAFREVGHIDHPGYHASEAVPLPDGRLLVAGYDEGWITEPL